MAALGSHGNVYNTCLLILKAHGFSLSIEDSDEGNDSSSTIWMAEKNGYDFHADNPIELLGLVSIYEYHRPDGEPTPYWWSIDGPDIFKDLILGNEV
jgi:hypothetical protein